MVTGTFMTYAMYSCNETGDLSCYGLIPLVLVAIGVCSIVTAVSFRIVQNPVVRLGLSLGLSYVAYIGLIIVASLVTGDYAETMMWFPIILFFGIPSMFLLTAGGIAGIAILSINREKTEPPDGGPAQKTALP